MGMMETVCLQLAKYSVKSDGGYILAYRSGDYMRFFATDYVLGESSNLWMDLNLRCGQQLAC